jgi:uncharacterized protein (UPF0333 family)
MVFARCVNKKGQLSIEFILIMTVVLLLIMTISIPMRDYGEQQMNEFTRVSYVDKAVTEIVNMDKKLDAMEEGRLSAVVYIPDGVDFNITQGAILYDINMATNMDHKGYPGCSGYHCKKEINLLGGYSEKFYLSQGVYRITLNKGHIDTIAHEPIKVN